MQRIPSLPARKSQNPPLQYSLCVIQPFKQHHEGVLTWRQLSAGMEQRKFGESSYPWPWLQGEVVWKDFWFSPRDHVSFLCIHHPTTLHGCRSTTTTTTTSHLPLSSSFVNHLPPSHSTMATGLSCQPLVFLLPRPGTTGSTGGYTDGHTHMHAHGHTHTQASAAVLFVIWHPSGGFCVFYMFVEERRPSGRLIIQGGSFVFIYYFVHYCTSTLYLFFPHVIFLQ